MKEERSKKMSPIVAELPAGENDKVHPADLLSDKDLDKVAGGTVHMTVTPFSGSLTAEDVCPSSGNLSAGGSAETREATNKILQNALRIADRLA